MASASEWCTEVSTLMNGRGVCLLPQTSRGRHLMGVGVWCSNPHQSVSLKIATHSLLLPYAHKRNRDARRGYGQRFGFRVRARVNCFRTLMNEFREGEQMLCWQ